MTASTQAFGVSTSILTTGSITLGDPVFLNARKHARAAIPKASSLESTSWYRPSISVNLKSTVGKPASTPVLAWARTPFSIAGMKLRGTAATHRFALEHNAGVTRQRLKD